MALLRTELVIAVVPSSLEPWLVRITSSCVVRPLLNSLIPSTVYENARWMILMHTSLMPPLSSVEPCMTPGIKFGLHYHMWPAPSLRFSLLLKRDSCPGVSVLSIPIARCQCSCFFKRQCPYPLGSSDILLATLSLTNTITRPFFSHCSRQAQRPLSHQPASTQHLLQSVIISFIYSFVYSCLPEQYLSFRGQICSVLISALTLT